MPNSKSAAKAHRVSERRRLRNLPIRTGVKTAIRKARIAIAQGPGEDALKEVINAQSKLDKAVSKGVIHRRAAARKKSRVMRRLYQAGATATPPAE